LYYSQISIFYTDDKALCLYFSTVSLKIRVVSPYNTYISYTHAQNDIFSGSSIV
jgi:hypothetical protein